MELTKSQIKGKLNNIIARVAGYDKKHNHEYYLGDLTDKQIDEIEEAIVCKSDLNDLLLSFMVDYMNDKTGLDRDEDYWVFDEYRLSCARDIVEAFYYSF